MERRGHSERGWARFWARLGSVPLGVAHVSAWCALVLWSHRSADQDYLALLTDPAAITQLPLAVGLYFFLIEALIRDRLNSEGGEGHALLSSAQIEAGLCCLGWLAYARVWDVPVTGFEYGDWAGDLFVFMFFGVLMGGPLGLVSWFLADSASTYIER